MSSTVDITNFASYAAVILASGAVLAPLLAQAIKKMFGLKSGAVIHTVVVALSAVMAGAQYLIQAHGKLPLAVPLGSAINIYGLSQLVYKYGGYAQDLIGRVNISLNSPASTPAADAAVNAVNVPEAVASATPAVVSEPVAPVAPINQEFSA